MFIFKMMVLWGPFGTLIRPWYHTSRHALVLNVAPRIAAPLTHLGNEVNTINLPHKVRKETLYN